MSDELEQENEKLLKKNRELLDELKKARAKNTEVEGLQEKLVAAEAEVLELKLKQPVRELLSQVLIPPNIFSIKEVMEDYIFQLDDQGAIQMLDGDKAVDFTVKSVTEHLGGAEKYAGVVRAMARNETLTTETGSKDGESKAHFGIR